MVRQWIRAAGRPAAAILLTVFLLAGCSGTVSSPRITETDVKALLDDVEKATLNRDVDGVVRHLAPFVVITLIMNTPEKQGIVQLTRDQYRSELEKAHALIVQHEYRRDHSVITVRDDGREATAEAEVRERIVLRDREMRTITRERAVLEIIDGKLMVTVLEGLVRPDH